MKRSLSVLVAVMALVGTACGSGGDDSSATPPSTTQQGAESDPEWDAIVAAAKQEGSVTLYLPAPGVAERLKPAFEEKYGITLEFVRAASGELITKLEQEKASGAAGGDVAFLADVAWFKGHAADMITPDGPDFAGWEKGTYWTDTHFVPAINPYVIAWNTSVVPGAITGYEDALTAAKDGQVGSMDVVSAAVSGWYSWLEEEFGDDYLTAFAAKKPFLYPSTVPGAQSLGSGEIGVALFMVPSAVKPLQDQGAPIEYVLPKPALGTPYGAAAVGWSKHPNAAKVLVNYMASKEGQRVVHGPDKLSISPLAGIEGALPNDGVTLWEAAAWDPAKTEGYNSHWRQVMGR
jgi:iron(III) transport system substrate-binding protein